MSSSNSIVDILTSQLGPEGIQTLGNRLGIDPATAQRAIAAAVPMLTGGLARNASQPQEAASILDAAKRDHDGSILDNLSGFFSQGDPSQGAGILGHIFGDRQGGAAAGLSKATGLDTGKAGQLLMMLAPLIMGAIGKLANQRNLDAGGLKDVLDTSATQARAQAPADLGGILGSFLDADKDGNVMDDLARMGGGLLGGLFGDKKR